MSFCFPSYDCCFASVSFHVPVLPFLPSFPRTSRLFRTSPPKILLSIPAPGPSFSVLHFSSLYPFLPCTAFSYPVLPFVPVLSMFVPYLPFQNPVEHAHSGRPLIQRTSFFIPLPFPLLYFLFSCISLSCTFLRFCTFHVFAAVPLSKSCWACPLQVPPPAYFLSFPFTLSSLTFLYCGYYFDFPLLCLIPFSSHYGLLDFSWKNYLYLLFFVCSLNLLHQLWLFTFFIVIRFSLPLFSWNFRFS